MLRMCRKRKKKDSDYSDQNKSQMSVKVHTEPVNDVCAIGYGCCLCSLTTGIELFTLFDESSKQADPATVEQIKICINREISPESYPGARICSACLQKLKAHHSFWKHALECNAYILNRMSEDIGTEVPTCRFCLQIDDESFHLFSEETTSNERHLRNIRECLSVQINKSDPVTNICGSCVQRINGFLDFRRKHELGAKFPNQKQKKTHLGISDLDFVQVAQDKRRRRFRTCSESEEITPEIRNLLLADTKGRNFEVALEDGDQLKVTYSSYQFQFHAMKENNCTLWYCNVSVLQKCDVKLEIDSKGQHASIVSKFIAHRHSVLSPKLLECPSGKGFAQSGDKKPFWLLPLGKHGYVQTRSLVFESYRYYLYNFKKSPISEWHCDKRKTSHCSAMLHIEGIFNQVCIKGVHNHVALAEEELADVLKYCLVNSKTSKAIRKFQANNPLPLVHKNKAKINISPNEKPLITTNSIVKEKTPEIFGKLHQNDPERPFSCVVVGSKLKVLKEGYEYRYFGTQEDNSTLWKCIMSELHHCLMTAEISADGKHFDIVQGIRHWHSKELAPIFRYPLGKRMVGNEPVWLIKRPYLYYESRYVIYQYNVFILRTINQKGEARLSCWSNKRCKVVLIVKGDFDDINLIHEHTHEKTSENVLTRLIEGRSDLLEPEKNLTFKQKIMSFPSMKGKIWDESRNEYETFYILNKVKTMDRIGHGLLFRGFKYSMISVDQFGTSRWACIKFGECHVTAIMEGIYESICVKAEHDHDGMIESEIDILVQKCTNNFVEGKSLIEHETKESESSTILSVLTHPDLKRNFSVFRLKNKLLINFEGEVFRIDKPNSDGTSFWCCTWLKKCPVILRLTADGQQVTLSDPEIKHNHSDEHKALFHLSCGKGLVYDQFKGANRCYWLYTVQSNHRTNRAIIYQGYKYHLNIIKNNGISSWKCQIRNCNVHVRVEGCFNVIFCQSRHTHDPLSSKAIFNITGFTNVDNDLLPDTNTLNITSLKGPRLHLALLDIFTTTDSSRNFEVSIKKKKLKIIQNNYIYAFHSVTETHFVWRCIHSLIHQCDAVFHIDHNGKHGFLPEHLTHNHSTELWEIFRYPVGQYEIFDASSKTMKPFWFQKLDDFVCPQLVLIFDGNKHNLTHISESGDQTTWLCTGNRCKVTVSVKGMFETITSGEHTHKHKPPSEANIANWIRKIKGFENYQGTEENGEIVTFDEVPMDIEDTIKLENL